MLEELFNVVPDAMVIVDGAGRIERANAQAEQLFGFAAGALVGVGVESLIPEKMRDRHRVHRAGYVANPRVRPMGGSGQSLIGRRSDGAEFPIEIALSPIKSAEGTRYLASIRDISESQRARQALVRARYDKLVARVGHLVLASSDEDSAMARLPAELVAALGIEAVALFSVTSQRGRQQLRASSGLEDGLLSMLEDSLSGDAPLGRLLAAGKSVVVEDFAAARDPRPPRVLVDAGFNSSVIVPLFDREQASGALLALSKRSHSFDHDALHCLQSIATLLSALLQRRRAEERLAHSQRLEAVGQLTGGIAHDFNNMLTVISGNLQLLELEVGTHPGAAELIEHAQRAVQNGAGLTAKLLAFARRQRLTPRAIEPGPLLQDLGRMLVRTLGDFVKVDIDCAAGIAPIFADASQLESALLNLALNSRDAMPRGGQLTIAACPIEVSEEAGQLELLPGPYVAFSITDTGHGMSPEVLERAFEPFFTTKEPGKGNGLGLSMVYGFVRQSGGQLRAESQLGYGTRVELFLPVAKAGAEVPAAPAARESHRGNERVLLVEDEPAVREVAVAFLRRLGYQVVAVAAAAEALRMLHADLRIALLFSDVALGEGMSGAELALAARALRPALAVLLTSGYEHQAPFAAGNDDAAHFELLRKPYRLEELAAALRRQLDAPLG